MQAGAWPERSRFAIITASTRTTWIESVRKPAAVRAAIVLTTEKDRVRLAACDLRGIPLAAVPLTVTIDPADAFANWLMGRIA